MPVMHFVRRMVFDQFTKIQDPMRLEGIFSAVGHNMDGSREDVRRAFVLSRFSVLS